MEKVKLKLDFQIYKLVTRLKNSIFLSLTPLYKISFHFNIIYRTIYKETLLYIKFVLLMIKDSNNILKFIALIEVTNDTL